MAFSTGINKPVNGLGTSSPAYVVVVVGGMVVVVVSSVVAVVVTAAAVVVNAVAEVVVGAVVSVVVVVALLLQPTNTKAKTVKSAAVSTAQNMYVDDFSKLVAPFEY